MPVEKGSEKDQDNLLEKGKNENGFKSF